MGQDSFRGDYAEAGSLKQGCEAILGRDSVEAIDAELQRHPRADPAAAWGAILHGLRLKAASESLSPEWCQERDFLVAGVRTSLRTLLRHVMKSPIGKPRVLEVLAAVFKKSRSGVPKATVHRILRNPVYYGDFEFKGRRYTGTHAPLVTREAWDRVQEALQRRPGKHRETKRNLAYTGLVTCGSCGCAITAEVKKGGRYTYYRCTGYKQTHPLDYTREEDLTEQFAAVLGDLFFDEEVVEWVRAALKESHVVERRDAEADAERLQAEHKRLEDRIHAMYLDKLDGRITAEFFDGQAAECRLQQERIRRLHVERQKAASDDYLDSGVRLLELARRAPDLFRRSTPAEKRVLLGYVLSNSTLLDGRLTVTYRQPFDLLADAVREEKAALAPALSESARTAIWGG